MTNTDFSLLLTIVATLGLLDFFRIVPLLQSTRLSDTEAKALADRSSRMMKAWGIESIFWTLCSSYFAIGYSNMDYAVPFAKAGIISCVISLLSNKALSKYQKQNLNRT